MTKQGIYQHSQQKAGQQNQYSLFIPVSKIKSKADVLTSNDMRLDFVSPGSTLNYEKTCSSLVLDELICSSLPDYSTSTQQTNFTQNKQGRATQNIIASDVLQNNTLLGAQQTDLTHNQISDGLLLLTGNVLIDTDGLPNENEMDSKIDEVITPEREMADSLSLNQVSLAGMASPLPPIENVDEFNYLSESIYTFYSSPSPFKKYSKDKQDKD